MIRYRTPSGREVRGVEIYGRLKFLVWEWVSSDDETGQWVVRDKNGDLLQLDKIPGTEADGPPPGNRSYREPE